jgi:predicted dehydrogenase
MVRPAEYNRRHFLNVAGKSTATLMVSVHSFRHTALGANDRIRIGLVGCGNRGVDSLMAGLLRLRQDHQLEIAGLCDVWKVNLARAVSRLAETQAERPLTCSRYEELLAAKDMDAIVIATPDFSHGPILVDCLRAGKDVYVEKQMSTTIKEAVLAVELARKNHCVVQVGTQLRSYHHFREGFNLIRSGVLGKISHVETQYHHNYAHWARDFSDVKKEDVDWDAFLLHLPREPFNPARFRRWHLYKGMTNGTPGLLATHYIDMATWYMNDPLPQSAVADGGIYVWPDGREIPDTMNSTLTYPGGWMLTCTSRFGNNFPLPKIRFYGTRGTFDNESWTATGIGGAKEALQEPLTIANREIKLEHEDDHHIRNWLDCMRSRQPTMAPVEAGYAHSIAAMMCFASWQNGRRTHYNAEKMRIEK